MTNEFIDYLQYERKYSSHTVLAYKEDLLQFEQFICAQTNMCDFTSIDASLARNWIVSLKQSTYSVASINRKISSLKSFYTYCKKKGIQTTNPFLRIHALKTKRDYLNA